MTWNTGDFYDASFGVHKSRRYHAKLRDFYQRLHDTAVAASAFAASGAFFAILGAIPVIAGILAAVVALASLFDLIFRFEQKARIHHDLCHRFSKLASDMELWDATDAYLKSARSRRIEIECEEPSEKRLVDLIAHNEELRARGIDESRLVPLSWLQRRLGYFFSFGLQKIEEKLAAKQQRRTVTPSAIT